MRYTIASVTIALALAQGPAQAHPHIFVDTQTGFYVDDAGQLTGLRVSWTYDEFTTLFMFDVLDLDQDRDGKLNDADFAAILKGETEWADDYNGDIHLEVNETPHPHLKPVGAQASYENDKITVQFDLPLAEPVAVTGQEVVLRTYDPSYYYSYTVSEVIDPAPLPAHCNAALYPFEPNALTGEMLVALSSLSREESPEDSNVGRLFSDEVVLSCG